LIEEVLSGVLSSSALRSGSVLAFELSLAHWCLILASSWDLVALVDNWIDLMANDEVMAVIIIVVLVQMHSRLCSLEGWNLWELIVFEAGVVWLESKGALLFHCVKVWIWNVERLSFLGLLDISWLVVVLKCDEEVLSDVFNLTICHIIIFVVIIVII